MPTEDAVKPQLRPITEIAAKLGLSPEDLELYGKYKAKVDPLVARRLQDKAPGKLVLVTAITPTPAGEGKTTIAIGLADALNRMQQKVVLCLREPSLGPVFGIKGGATGGGKARVVPSEDINLHFNGDFHAVSSAHNLLAALVDNHLQQGNTLGIDPRSITWPRTVDMNDRALRDIVIGLGGKNQGVPREDRFVITPASEVMASLCLARDLADLRERLGRIIVGSTYDNKPVRASDLKAHGAMAALLKDAVKPNLVQTAEGTPAFVHGGPFANIAHGTNTAVATRLALKLGDYIIQEAGFGADLGAEKFVHIFCRIGQLRPAAAVIVATIRALKLHGGMALADLAKEDLDALGRGLANLEKHLENVQDLWGIPAVVAINRFGTDTDAEVALLRERVAARGARVALADIFAKGGEGGIELAQAVLNVVDRPGGTPLTAATIPGDGHAVVAGGEDDSGLRFVYDLNEPITVKIEKTARAVYGAGRVEFSKEAERAIKRMRRWGLDNLPVCMAKTQYSLSDNPDLRGRPEGFTLSVREVYPSAGAGFLVAVTGEIMTMPGLPKEPAAEIIDVTADGDITGQTH